MKRLPRGYWYARLKEFERVMNALVRDGLTDEERARARGGGAAVLGAGTDAGAWAGVSRLSGVGVL